MANEHYGGTSITGMVRGFVGMMHYYAFIGLLLGLFALCIGGPLTVIYLMGLVIDERPQQSNAVHYTPGPDTPDWLRPYVGSYDRHGQALDIAPDGTGLFRSRTYTSCAQDPTEPCEQEIGDMPLRIPFTVVQGPHGPIARSQDGDLPLVLVKPGILEYDGLTYCESNVVDPDDPAIEPCGA